MYGCDSWTVKKAEHRRIICFWTVVLEKTLESPLDCKQIQSVHSEGDQPWDFFGRNDAKAETPVLWPHHAKSWLIGKDSDAGRDWGQEEKGMTEDETAGWHHLLNGHEFEWTLWVGDGQGAWRAAIYGSQRVGHNWATDLNWTEPKSSLSVFACSWTKFSNSNLMPCLFVFNFPLPSHLSWFTESSTHIWLLLSLCWFNHSSFEHLLSARFLSMSRECVSMPSTFKKLVI